MKLLHKLFMVFLVATLLTACRSGSDRDSENNIGGDKDGNGDSFSAEAANYVLQEDSPLAFTLQSSGAVGDSEYLILQGPQNGSIAGDPPNVSYAPDPNFYGEDSLQFTVISDGVSATPAEVSFSVLPVNDPPEFVSEPRSVAEENTSYQYQIQIADVDSSPALALIEAPAGMSLNAETSTLSWTPEANSSGSHPIILKATDEEGFVEQSFNLVIVRSADNPPPPEIEPDEADLVNQEGIVGFDVDRVLLPIGNTPNQLTFSTNVSRGLAQQLGNVELQEVTVDGSTVSLRGSMSDSGTDADLNFNDGIYTIEIDVKSEQMTTHYYRSTVNKTDGTQVESRIVRVDFVPEPYTWEIAEEDLVTPEDGGPRYLPNHLIVMLAEGIEVEFGQLLAEKYGAEIVGFNALPPTFGLRFAEIDDVESLMTELEADPRVDVAMEILEPGLNVSNDALRLDPWLSDLRVYQYYHIGAHRAWELLADYVEEEFLAPVHIGVVDTEIYFDHPELQNVNRNELFPKDGSLDHGTAVTGVIAAGNNFSGSNGLLGGVVANSGSSTVLPLTITEGVLLDPYFMIPRAIFAGARTINLSYGMDPARGFSKDQINKSAAIHERFYRRYRSISFVVGAGNFDADARSQSTSKASQAAYDNLYIVGGSATFNVPQFGNRWINSHHGNNITLMAPAEDIWVLSRTRDPNGNITYGHQFASGTSLSAPMVSASLGLLNSINPSLGNRQLKQLLQQTSDIVPVDKEMNGPMTGTGRRLNIGDAVDCTIVNDHWEYLAGAGYIPNTGQRAGSRNVPVDGWISEILSDSPTYFAHGPDGRLFFSGRYIDFQDDGSIDYTTFIRSLDPTRDSPYVYGFYEITGGRLSEASRGITGLKTGVDRSLYYTVGNATLYKVDLDNASQTRTELFTSSENTFIRSFDVAEDGTIYFVEDSVSSSGPSWDVLIKKRDVDGTISTVVNNVRSALGGVAAFAISDIEVGPSGNVYVSARITAQTGFQTSFIYEVTESGGLDRWATFPHWDKSNGDTYSTTIMDFDIDAFGRIYAADGNRQALYRVNPDRSVELVFNDNPDESRASKPWVVTSVDKGCRVYFMSNLKGEIHQMN